MVLRLLQGHSRNSHSVCVLFFSFCAKRNVQLTFVIFRLANRVKSPNWQYKQHNLAGIIIVTQIKCGYFVMTVKLSLHHIFGLLILFSLSFWSKEKRKWTVHEMVFKHHHKSLPMRILSLFVFTNSTEKLSAEIKYHNDITVRKYANVRNISHGPLFNVHKTLGLHSFLFLLLLLDDSYSEISNDCYHICILRSKSFSKSYIKNYFSAMKPFAIMRSKFCNKVRKSAIYIDLFTFIRYHNTEFLE